MLETTLAKSEDSLNTLMAELDLAMSQMDSKAKKSNLFTRMTEVKKSTEASKQRQQ